MELTEGSETSANHNLTPGSTLKLALEDGTDRGFRNVGKSQSDAGEILKRIHTIFKTRRKFEIKNTYNLLVKHIYVYSRATIF
jgi:hypothetical protein